MSAATLQALSPDADVWLGVGVSAPGILRQHGAPAPDRPIARMREYVALLRECLVGIGMRKKGIDAKHYLSPMTTDDARR